MEGLEREGFGLTHHEEAGEALDGGGFVGGVHGLLEGVEGSGGVGEAEARKRGVARVGGLVEESGVAAEEAKDGHGEAEGALPVGDGAGGEEAGGGAVDGVFEEASGFEVGVPVDYVVDAPVLHPFEADLSDGSGLGAAVEGGGGPVVVGF